MARTYSAMARDRAEAERKQKHGRVDSIQDMRKWQEEATELVRQERHEREMAKSYLQPVSVVWHEFLKWRGWDERIIGELADDFVFAEFSIYSLKIQYGLSLG